MSRDKRKEMGKDVSDLFVDESESDVERSDDEKLKAKETPSSKRRRLAKSYLDEIKLDEQDDDNEVEERLRADQLKASGKILREYSKYIRHDDPLNIKIHTLSSGRKEHRSRYKDGSVIKWDLDKRRFLKRYSTKPASSYCSVLCISASSDAKLLAVGKSPQCIDIWSIEEDRFIGTLTSHKKAITGLTFRYNTHTLYSCSADQTVMIWDVDAMTLVDRLFGHEDAILSIDSLKNERCITAGSRDRTIRYWKIPEETQLVFREKQITNDEIANNSSINLSTLGSIESVASLDEDLFVSGSDIGSISLWSILKKKPIFIKKGCHESNGILNTSGIGIFSLSALRYTDIFASGSNMGNIKIWKVNNDRRSFLEILNIQMIGFISCLKLFDAADIPLVKHHKKTPKIYLAAAVAKEHPLGRWVKSINDAKNHISIIELCNGNLRS